MPDTSESSVETKLVEAGRHSIIYGIGSVAQSAVQFILIPILTGQFTKDEFGAYSLILMLSTVAGAVFYLGMTSAMPRSYFDYKSTEDRRAVFTTAFLILLLGAALQSFLGFFGGRAISSILLRDDRYVDAVTWAMLGSALSFINQYFFTFLRFLRKSIVSVSFSLFSLIGNIGLSLFFLSISHNDVAAPFKAASYIQLFIAFLFVVSFGRKAFIFRGKKAELFPLLAFGAATVVASFATMLLDWSDRIIIERYVSLADVGIYSAGYKLGSLINVIMIAPFAQIWSPMMMEYRTHSNIKELFTRILSYFLLIGSWILIGAALFLGDFLPILVRSGPNESLLSVVLLVMTGYLLYGTTNILSAGLFYERKIRFFSYVYYAIAGLKIVTNLFLIPLLGIGAAALTTMLAYILIPVAIYIVAYRYFSFPIEWKRIGLLSANCALPLIYGICFWSLFRINLPVRIVWFLAQSVIIYFVCLSAEERKKIRSIVFRMKEKVPREPGL